jgi:hypothetical protein
MLFFLIKREHLRHKIHNLKKIAMAKKFLKTQKKKKWTCQEPDLYPELLSSHSFV